MPLLTFFYRFLLDPPKAALFLFIEKKGRKANENVIVWGAIRTSSLADRNREPMNNGVLPSNLHL